MAKRRGKKTKRRTKKSKVVSLISMKERRKFIDKFVDGMIAEEQEDSGDRYNTVAERIANRWYKKFEKMSDKALIKFAYREWEELAESIFGSKAEWAGL